MKKIMEQIETQLSKNGFIIVYKDIDLAPEEKFAQIRMMGLGASDSSKLLNVNPFPNGTSDDLIKEKVTGRYDESIGKKASVRMGKEIEHLILTKSEQLIQADVIKPTDMYGNLQTHLTINFDGVVLPPSIPAFPLEAKACTMYGRKYYDWNKSEIFTLDGELQPQKPKIEPFDPVTIESIADYCRQASAYYGIPVYYYTQLQQQILGLGSDFGFLSVLDVANWDMHLFRVHASLIVQNALKNKATKLWALIQTKKDLLKPKETIDTTKEF